MSETENNGTIPEPIDPLEKLESEAVESETQSTGSIDPFSQLEVGVTEDRLEFQPPTSVEVETLLDEADEDAETTAPIAEALDDQSDLDVAELVNLNQALHQQNTELLEHVEQLEKLLEECHSALQSQMQLRTTAETKLTAVTQELTTTQEQVTRLFRELEASHQVAQRQQILIETLTQQLESSAEQVAQIERECALTQQRYSEREQQALQTEMVCQELRSRLQRQQRYTLQFKAALNKCLEMPVPALAHPTANAKDAAPSQPSSPKTTAEPYLQLKPQPIEPWSATLEVVVDEPDRLDSNPLRSSEWFWDMQEEKDREELLPAERAETIGRSVESIPSDSPAQTDRSIELASDLTKNLREAEEALWQELERLTETTGAPINTSLSENLANVSLNSAELKAAIDIPVSQTKDSEPENEVALPQFAAEEEIANSASNADTAQANWPSPVVNPMHRPKKIESLAAVDLPFFPKMSN